jgi:Acyl-CoA dehydrogenase, C-terminal domain
METDELEVLNETLLSLAASEEDGQITAALDAFGWLEMLVAHPEEAISALFAVQGRTGTWSAALHDVLAADVESLGVTTPVCVVLPRPRSSHPGEFRDGMVAIDGILLGPRDDAATFVVAVGSASPGRHVVALDPGDLKIERRRGLDPGLCAYTVSGTTARMTVLAEDQRADVWWQEAQARGRLSLCQQIVGALFVMIEQARAHVSGRTQFGRRVGTFQAVRHKLVEAYVATVAADCSVMTAWESEHFPMAAATAKVVTGKAVDVTAAHTQQLLAGVGFTAGHPYHEFMKRAVVLERVLGSGKEVSADLGGRLITHGAAPRLVQL